MTTTQTKPTFKIDNTEILINQNHTHTQYVPKDSLPYLDTNNSLSTIAYAINENLPVLMIGETGTGKTSAIRYLARETNNNLRRVNLNGSTTVEELVGKILINKDGTYWVDGVLTECMRNGYWILIDEINAALPEVLFVLHSLLDDDGYIVLSEKEDKEIVKPHPDFRVFATMNPFEDYVGTKELNKAFLSRFPITIKVEYPNEAEEKKILRARFPIPELLSDETISDMVDFVSSARDSRANEELDFIFSTRDLIQWATVYHHTQSAKKAAEMTFLPKCNKEDASALRNLIGIQFIEGDVVFTQMVKGSKFKLKDHVVVPNIGKIIPAGSVLKIVDWQKIDSSAITTDAVRKVSDAVKVSVERVPNIKDLTEFSPTFNDIDNQKRLVGAGQEWTVAIKDFENKFVPTKA